MREAKSKKKKKKRARTFTLTIIRVIFQFLEKLSNISKHKSLKYFWTPKAVCKLNMGTHEEKF